MIAKTILCASSGRRDPIAGTKSIMGALGYPILAAMIAVVCVADVAMAAPAQSNLSAFEGRWTTKEATSAKKVTIDISRCGAEVCGVIVENGSCGAVALRVNDRPLESGRQRGANELYGELRFAANTEPYHVRATLSRGRAGVTELSIIGTTGNQLSLFVRRTYDYSQLMVRSGNATCRPDPKVS